MCNVFNCFLFAMIMLLLRIFSHISGGFMGLMLGASVLTICELIDFIIITWLACCSTRKKNKSEPL